VIPCNHYDLQTTRWLTVRKQWQDIKNIPPMFLARYYQKPSAKVKKYILDRLLSYSSQRGYLCIAIWFWRVVGKLEFVTLTVCIKNKLQETNLGFI
jgi:hypothetical protein